MNTKALVQATALLVTFVFAVPNFAEAVDRNPLRPADTSSPRATLRSLIEYVDEGYRGMADLYKSYDNSGRLYLNAKERHEHQQRQAQRDIEALHQALHDLGLPDDLVTEIEGRLRAQKKLLGKIFGLMFPTLFGCINAYELGRTRGWDKNLFSRILGALPKRSWRIF